MDCFHVSRRPPDWEESLSAIVVSNRLYPTRGTFQGSELIESGQTNKSTQSKQKHASGAEAERAAQTLPVKLCASSTEPPDPQQKMQGSEAAPTAELAAPAEQGDDAADPSGAAGVDAECMVCMETPSTHMMFPCGHAGFCEACAEKCTSGRKGCPVCNGVVKKVISIEDVNLIKQMHVFN